MYSLIQILPVHNMLGHNGKLNTLGCAEQCRLNMYDVVNACQIEYIYLR